VEYLINIGIPTQSK